MRVLLVCNTSAYLKNMWLPLARGLRASGGEVVLAAPVDQETPTLREAGFGFEPLTRLKRGGGSPVRELGAFLELWRLYRRLRPAVVHHFTLKPILYGSLAARLAGISVRVATVSGMGTLFVRTSWFASLLQRLLLIVLRPLLHGASSWVVFQNPDDRDLLVSKRVVRGDRAVVIRGSGVDTDRFTPTPLPDGEPKVLCAARLLWEKGIAEYVEAARRLLAAGTYARFLLAGWHDTDHPGAIPASAVEQWKREGAVEFIGFCEDMVGLLREVYVVTLPSKYREGVPRILVEAAASGRPLVATDVSGCREICVDGVTGLLVEPGSVDGLAAALQDLLENRDWAAELGLKGRDLAVEAFDIRSVVARTLSVYRAATKLPASTVPR